MHNRLSFDKYQNTGILKHHLVALRPNQPCAIMANRQCFRPTWINNNSSRPSTVPISWRLSSRRSRMPRSALWSSRRRRPGKNWIESEVELSSLESQLSDFKKDKAYWQSELSAARVSMVAAANAHAAPSIKQGRYRDSLILSTNWFRRLWRQNLVECDGYHSGIAEH